MAHAKIISVVVHAPHLAKISDSARQKIYAAARVNAVKNANLPPPENTKLITKLGRAKNDLKVWNAAGRPIASKAVRAQRLAACKACAYFNPKGNLLFGECKAPGCGCTRAKLFLLTAKCPYPGGSRWTKP